MERQTNHLYEFGDFRLDATEHLLWRDGQPVALTPKAIEMLIVLVQDSGHVIEKNELMNAVWPDAFVEETNLTRNIFTLRQTLGDGKNGGKYIETIPKRGYRFVAGVREVMAETVAKEHTWSSQFIRQELETGGPNPIKIERTVQEKLHGSDSGAMHAVKRNLRGVITAVCAALLLGVSLSAYRLISGRTTEVHKDAEIRSIAVLPFKPLVADRRDESLELGMADMLITKLGGSVQIAVRPISAVRKYDSLEQDPLAAGREQKVDAVLDGSIHWEGGKIRVTMRLLNVADGRTLWADRCDDQCTNIFEVQDSISDKVVSALTVKLAGEEAKRLTRRYTDNTEAFRLYLKGRYHLKKFTTAEVNTAIGYFEQAIAKDSNYALAYAGLADGYLELSTPSIGLLTARESLSKAKAAALKALEIDETLVEARVALANIKRNVWDWLGAEREYKRIIELNPNSPPAHSEYGGYLSQVGRHDQCIAEMKRALELDPLDSYLNSDFGFRLYIARRYDEAIEQFQKCLDMEPYSWTPHNGLAWVYEEQGKYDEAIAEYQKAKSLTGNNAGILCGFGSVYAALGKRAEARNMIAQMQKLSKQRYVSAYLLAQVYARLGEKDEALAWLQKGYEDGDIWMKWLKVDRMFDSVRPDPRFQELLRRIGLGPEIDALSQSSLQTPYLPLQSRPLVWHRRL
jgi:DNA-binding winged helix-turn-helix (wHTH) protein/TolB-like protein/Flp pilus assembly protein TadD